MPKLNLTREDVADLGRLLGSALLFMTVVIGVLYAPVFLGPAPVNVASHSHSMQVANR